MNKVSFIIKIEKNGFYYEENNTNNYFKYLYLYLYLHSTIFHKYTISCVLAKKFEDYAPSLKIITKKYGHAYCHIHIWPHGFQAFSKRTISASNTHYQTKYIALQKQAHSIHVINQIKHFCCFVRIERGAHIKLMSSHMIIVVE